MSSTRPPQTPRRQRPEVSVDNDDNDVSEFVDITIQVHRSALLNGLTLTVTPSASPTAARLAAVTASPRPRIQQPNFNANAPSPRNSRISARTSTITSQEYASPPPTPNSGQSGRRRQQTAVDPFTLMGDPVEPAPTPGHSGHRERQPLVDPFTLMGDPTPPINAVPVVAGPEPVFPMAPGVTLQANGRPPGVPERATGLNGMYAIVRGSKIGVFHCRWRNIQHYVKTGGTIREGSDWMGGENVTYAAAKKYWDDSLRRRRVIPDDT